MENKNALSTERQPLSEELTVAIVTDQRYHRHCR